MTTSEPSSSTRDDRGQAAYKSGPLDPYLAVGKALANMTTLLGEPPPPQTVRNILLELGFTHPVEQVTDGE